MSVYRDVRGRVVHAAYWDGTPRSLMKVLRLPWLLSHRPDEIGADDGALLTSNNATATIPVGRWAVTYAGRLSETPGRLDFDRRYTADERKRVYIVETTVTERYFYDPAEIKEAFGEMWDAYDGSFEDFVVQLFEEHEGSQFHGKWFRNDANPNVGVELIERWDDE